MSRAFLPAIVILLVQSPPIAMAQESVEFFNDFSRDSISYILDARPDEKRERSYAITPDGVEMQDSATGDNQGFAKKALFIRSPHRQIPGTAIQSCSIGLFQCRIPAFCARSGQIRVIRGATLFVYNRFSRHLSLSVAFAKLGCGSIHVR